MSDVVFIALAVLLGFAAGRQLRPLLVPYDIVIPRRLPIPELACGVLFGLATHTYSQSWRAIPVLVLVVTCVALAIVDFVKYRLPNALLFPGLVASVALIVVGEAIEGHGGRAAGVAVGALLYSAVLFVLYLVNPAGLGFGDVKLALLLGAFLGWVADGRLAAVQAVMLGLLIGSALGVVLGVGRLVAVRLGRRFLPDPLVQDGGAWHKTTFPFGPPLMVATIVIVMWPSTFVG